MRGGQPHDHQAQTLSDTGGHGKAGLAELGGELPCHVHHRVKGAMEEDSPSTASKGQTQHVTKTKLTLLRVHTQVTPQRVLKGFEGEKLSSW